MNSEAPHTWCSTEHLRLTRADESRAGEVDETGPQATPLQVGHGLLTQQVTAAGRCVQASGQGARGWDRARRNWVFFTKKKNWLKKQHDFVVRGKSYGTRPDSAKVRLTKVLNTPGSITERDKQIVVMNVSRGAEWYTTVDIDNLMKRPVSRYKNHVMHSIENIEQKSQF